jgi:hypothetical protein
MDDGAMLVFLLFGYLVILFFQLAITEGGKMAR